MSVGGEVVRTIPLQRIAVVRRSHNNEGTRLIPLLLANASYVSGIIQISGNTDIEIFNQADVIGTMYIYMGVDPTVLLAKLPGEEIANSPYAPANEAASYTQRCSTEYVMIVYVNGDAIQTKWEFSIQLRPIGR